MSLINNIHDNYQKQTLGLFGVAVLTNASGTYEVECVGFKVDGDGAAVVSWDSLGVSGDESVSGFTINAGDVIIAPMENIVVTSGTILAYRAV